MSFTGFATKARGNSYEFEGDPNEGTRAFSSIDVDHDFLETYKLQLLRGRKFDPAFGIDDKSLIINEACQKFFGWEDPLDRQVVFNDVPGYRVIGVVRDFHFASLHESIEPVIISIRKHRFRYLSIKLAPGDTGDHIDRLKDAWKNIDPERPFDFIDFSATIDRLYGLVNFMAEQKTKEIGVRKALGATTASITRLLTLRFLRPVLMANLIALPASYYLSGRWLDNYPYRESPAIWIFLLALGSSLIVALLSVNI